MDYTAVERALVSALESLNGMANRVFPILDIEKSTGAIIAYEQTQFAQQRQLEGLAGLVEVGYHVHVLHGTYERMRLLAESVRAAMEALEGTAPENVSIDVVTVELGSPDIRENKVQLYRRTYDVTIYYRF